MVEFKKYEGSTTELVSLGTVKDLAGKNGKIAFIRKNYKDSSKRVVVLVTKKDGTSATIPCSKQVSDAFRAKEINVAQLLGLDIIETELEKDGKLVKAQFVAMPATGGIHEISVDKVSVQELALEEATNVEDLAW